MRIIQIVSTSLFLLGFCMVGMTQKSNYGSLSNPNTSEHLPGVLIVKYKSTSFTDEPATTSRTASSSPLSRIPVTFQAEPIFKTANKSGRSSSKSGIDFTTYGRVTFDHSLELSKVAKEISKLPEVEYVEPVYLDRRTYTPNDPQFSNQGHLATIKALTAWDVTKGSSDVVVAIVDAGVDYEHEDLANKIYLNEDEIPDNRIDDDGDGYVDNYYGWDFAGDDFENIVQDNDPLAQKSNIDHGTAVAGCAAADTDNGIGVAGIGFNTKYLAIKCSAENDTRDNGGAFLLNTNFAVIYAVDQGADIINMSYGGTNYSQFGQDVMTYAAVEHDVVLVAAAGNSGTQTIQYPAGYNYVLAVANTDNDDFKANSSTYGKWVDMSAPGTSVRTTGILDKYINISGTSFSSPITAGAAALLRAQFPDYNQNQIRQLLIQTSDDIYDKNTGFQGLLGKGRLNVARALTVSTPVLLIDDFEVKTASGGIPLLGEEAFVDFSLSNDLAATSSSAFLTIKESHGITLSGTTSIEFGVLNTDEVLNYDDIISFMIPDTVGFNELLEFEIVLEDPGKGYKNTFFFEVVVNPIVTESLPLPYLLADGGDFESGSGGFVSGPISGDVNLWERGVPENELIEVNSGNNAWKTDLDGDLVKETYQCVLQSPSFDFSDQTKEYVLSFYKSMESEFCNAPSAVQMQYSFDQVNWYVLGSRTDIEGINWYNKDINSGCPIDESILADQDGWIGNFSNEYTEYDVSFLSGNEAVTFRYLLSVSGGFESEIADDGFMIDDFQIEVLNPSAEFYTPKRVNYVGQVIEFEYLSNGATSFSWEFGDGSASTEPQPTHFYEVPGYYDVSLTINSSNGEVTLTKEAYILVLPVLETPFTLSDGGNFESNQNYFGPENITGTPFELGESEIVGKDGTSSGSNAWVTGIDEDEYLDESEAYLYSPEFDFTYLGQYMLSFKAKYEFELAWDGFIVEYSTDKGTSWTKLDNEVKDNWYDEISDENSVFGVEVPIFTGSTDGVFVEKNANVSFLTGEEGVSFRFKFLTDANTVDVGLALDDFTLSGPGSGDVVAGFNTTLIDGFEGCSESTFEFSSISTGAVTALDWDFGDGVSDTKSGVGPISVYFENSGSKTISLTVTDVNAGTFTIDTTFTISDLHQPSISSSENEDGTFALTVSDGDSFQWYLDDELIEGATSNTLQADESGIYSVAVDIDGCVQFGATETKIIVLSTMNGSSVLLFPNPFTDHFQVEGLSAFGEYSWSLMDLSGRIMMKSRKLSMENVLQLNTSKLTSGEYLLKIHTSSEQITTKVFKR
ncbi:MAG: S8 family serine peptidase [Marinoscillum sp.]